MFCFSRIETDDPMGVEPLDFDVGDSQDLGGSVDEPHKEQQVSVIPFYNHIYILAICTYNA
jgi:hypothetical protein